MSRWPDAAAAIFNYAEREPWRREAEVACLNSGTVKEGAGLVRISPIEGPGMCGADFPLKVSALGEGPALGYVEEPVRPPGIDRRARAVRSRSRAGRSRSSTISRAASPRAGAPMSIEAPGVRSQPQLSAAAAGARRAAVQSAGAAGLAARATVSRLTIRRRRRRSRCAAAEEIETEELPPYARPGAAPIGPPQSARPCRSLCRRSVRRAIRSLPPRTPIEVKPAATLACPIVSALDRWFANAVQPAARKWFNQPVVEIKQISAYSCRGMNGQPGAHISEHAFGNALDIAAFVLADGHRITVKDGWKGSPEEQGFLRDVQGSACDQFTTVLAPGSNQFHYDHIHVDLMRRASGRRICQPGAVDGEVVASLRPQEPAIRVIAADRAAADAALRSAGRAGQRSVRLARRRPPRRPGHHRLDRRAAARDQGPGGGGPRLGRGAGAAAGDRLEHGQAPQGVLSRAYLLVAVR